MTAEFGLLIPFNDQSKSFTLGFEAGQIYEALTDIHASFGRTVHTCNLGQIRTIVETMGFQMTEEPTIEPEWTNISVKPRLTLVKS